MQEFVLECKEGFSKKFGHGTGLVCTAAPGRVNLIGKLASKVVKFYLSFVQVNILIITKVSFFLCVCH